MAEKQAESVIEDLEQQVVQAEKRAQSAERLLQKAKQELLTLSTSANRERYKVLQEQLNDLETQNAHLTLALGNLQKQLTEHQKDATRWRGRFLMSEIDVVSASHRAETAEKKLTEVVKPMPYDQKQLVKEREMSWMAFTDPVTELGNSNKLDIDLKEKIESSLRQGQLLALFMLDVDRFTQVNDFAGWEEGNQVLKELAKRLSENVPESTYWVRRAEDEFALVVGLDTREQMAESPLVRCRQIADFILRVISVPFKINFQFYPLTASLGISICPDDADTPLELLENAYSALQTAKAQGGNQYVIYSDRVYENKERRAALASELKSTIEQNQLKFLFRPVADVQKGNLAAAFVEPNWEHPAHGRVDQETFVPLAEEYGLVSVFVGQLVGAACEVSRKMKGSCTVILRCPKSVLQISEFPKKLMDMATKARINPQTLCLELPVDALCTHLNATSKLFSELARWNIRCAVRLSEDSAVPFPRLQQAGIGLITLSPELMDSVPAQESRRSVIQSFLDSSNRLGIPILTQGVQDNSQGHFLALHQCDWASGDFISPALELGDFVKRRRTTWQFK